MDTDLWKKIEANQKTLNAKGNEIRKAAANRAAAAKRAEAAKAAAKRKAAQIGLAEKQREWAKREQKRKAPKSKYTPYEELMRKRAEGDRSKAEAIAKRKSPVSKGGSAEQQIAQGKVYKSELTKIAKDSNARLRSKAVERRATPEQAKRQDVKTRSGATPDPARRKQVVSAARRRDRQERIKSGDFKGKYYGPDRFKGNLAAIDAWKAKRRAAKNK